jgi:uncharacterized membrane protein YjgN (DUF898 family)
MATVASSMKAATAADKPVGAAMSIPFEFTGKSGEFFKIWIVNIMLTILTLGIYSAWAKVRTKRYFYGNTLLQNAGFEYLAEPMQILKGRLLAFGIFALYMVVSNFLPIAAPFLALLFVLLLPWLVIKARMFSSRYSAYRNIRFDFKARYGQALAVYVGWPILCVLTLGLLFPYYSFRRSQFLVAHSAYGTTKFEFAAPARQFYIIYLKAAALLVLGVIAAALLAGGLGKLFGGAEANTGAILTPGLVAIAVIFFYLAAWAYLTTAISNLVWSNIKVTGQRLRSTLQTSHMLWLYLSNAVAIVLSLGLLLPWAQIRMARYRIAKLKLLATGDLEGFIGKQHEQTGSVGEEIGEFFDIDIGL